MSLKQFVVDFPEYAQYTDKDLTEALYKKYGRDGESYTDYARNISAAGATDDSITTKDLTTEDKQVTAGKAFIAARNTPEQKFADKHGNTYRGDVGEPGLAYAANRSLKENIVVNQALQNQAVKMSKIDKVFTTDPVLDYLTLEGDLIEEQSDRPGKILKTYIKKTFKDVSTGMLLIGEKSAVGRIMMNPSHLIDLDKEYKKAEQLKGEKLTSQERENILNSFARKKDPTFLKAYDESFKYVQEQIKLNPEYLQTESFWEDVIAMAPQVMGQLLIAAATGGFGATVSIGTMITGANYNDYIDKGVAPRRALNHALAVAMVSAPMEAFGITRFTKFFKLKAPIYKKLKGLGETLLAEFITETAQAHPEYLGELFATNPDRKTLELLNQWLNNAWEITKQGMYEGAVAIVLPGSGGVLSIGNQIVSPERKPGNVKENIKNTIDESDLSEEKKVAVKKMVDDATEVLDPVDVDEMTGAEIEKTKEAMGIVEEKKTPEDQSQIIKEHEKEVNNIKAGKKPTEVSDKEKLVDAQTRSIKVTDIKNITDPATLDNIIETYTKLDEITLKKNDSARLKAAKETRVNLIAQEIGFTEKEIKSGFSKTEQSQILKGYIFDKGILVPPTKKLVDKALESKTTSKEYKAALQSQLEQYQGVSQAELDEQPIAPSAVSLKSANVVEPTGQRPIKDSPHLGKVFTRRDSYVEQSGRAEEVKDAYLGSNNSRVIEREVGLQIIERLEEKIFNGEFEYQFLIDKLISSGKKVEFYVGDLNDQTTPDSVTRGLTTSWVSNQYTGQVGEIHVGLNPDALARDLNQEYAEGTLVHELIHAIYRAELGSAKTTEMKGFLKDVEDIWFSIPKKYLDRMHGWATEYDMKNVIGSPYKAQWESYTVKQRNFRKAWSTIVNAAKKTGDPKYGNKEERSEYWEEIMANAFSRVEISRVLASIKSINPRTKAPESIWQRIIRALFKNIPLKGVKSQTILDDLLAVENKWLTRVSQQAQEIAGEEFKKGEYHSYELDIKKFHGFPKGATSLQPALIDSESGKTWVSPLGHWDIKGAPIGSLDGFAAVDKSGKILDYYTREEAGRMVDPHRKVIDPDSGALTGEDIRYSNFETEPTVVKEAKKRLSEKDKMLLDARRKGRGNKTLTQHWADERADNQKVREAYVKKHGVESRWDKLNPTAGLSTMQPTTLENEASKVRAKLKEAVDKGLTNFQGQIRYYETRLQAISLLQEKALRNDLAKQRAAEEKLTKDAGATEAKQTKFFKAEYKRLVHLDAPHSSVQFAKNSLIDLVGPKEFYDWSGEDAPPILKTDLQKLGTPSAITKVKAFTEEDSTKREKTMVQTGAKTAGESRRVLAKQMKYVREKYIITGKAMPKKVVDQIIPSIKQAREVYGIIDDIEAKELVTELAQAITGQNTSYENLTITRENIAAKVPIQRILDKNCPRKVKFETYCAPNDGYVPSGYMFTVIDRDSSAYGSSLAVDKLDKKTLVAKIKEAEDLRTKIHNYEFEITMDGEGVTKARSNFGPDSRILIEFDHRKIDPYSEDNQTTISFLLEEKGITPTYERYSFYDTKIKDKAKKGIQTIRAIQRMLFDLLNNQYNAKVPRQIVFTGSTYDEKKNKIYKGFAQRLAKHLGWKLKIKRPIDGDPNFIITNPISQKVENELWDSFENNKLISDDMPNYDPLVNYETQKLDDTPFKFGDDKMHKDSVKGEAGFIAPNYFTRFLNHMRNDFKKNFREFKHLARKTYSDVQYKLRSLKKSQSISMAKTAKLLAKNLDGLSKNEISLLTKVSYMMDFYEQVKMNQKLRTAGEKVVVKEFPYGWTEKQILTETPRVWAAVQGNAKVLRAWYNRLDMWRQLRVEYISAMNDVGFSVENKITRAFYFRHQILDILKAQQAQYSQTGSGGKLAVPTRRSSLRKRKGGAYEMNLNYIQAEFEVMSQMMHDTQIGRTLKAIMDKYGSKTEKKGYSPYNPREDSIFYLANSIPGKMAQEAMEKGLKELNVPVSKINKIVALGGKYESYFLPDSIAETLNDALARPKRGPFLNAVRHTMRMWKMWQLLHPFRALKYNFRNLTGDAEAMFVGDPATFKYVWGAAKDLKEWKKTGVAPKHLQDWIDRGGTESTLQSQEMGKMLTDPMFVKHYSGKKKITDPATWYGKKARAWTDTRESLFRYAAYKRYVTLLESGGKIKNYAASMPEEVNQIVDDKDKAFLMSNDLLGAYDRITTFGENFRTYLAPFWSFQEINMKRTLQFARNAVKNDDLMATIGRKLGAKGVIIPIKLGKFAFKMGMLHVATQAWNQFVWPDEEDALPDEMHRRVHIIYGNHKDQILYFPRIGILGDLLEWAGVDTAPTDAMDILIGKKTFKDVIASYDMGKKNIGDIMNKIAQSLGPYVKMPVELVMGEKVFPSIWNRQPITDRLRYVAEQLQADVVYDAITGRPTKESHWVDAAMKLSPIYKGDRKRFGWIAIQQKVHEYLKEAKPGTSGFIVTESGNALYNMGMAYRYGDDKAMRKYFKEFMVIKQRELGGRINYSEVIRKQWLKLDPLAKFPKGSRHRRLFLASLNKRDQYALGLAYQYYAEIKSGEQFYKRLRKVSRKK